MKHQHCAFVCRSFDKRMKLVIYQSYFQFTLIDGKAFHFESDKA